MKHLLSMAVVLGLLGCAANPKETALTLRPNDPKYDTDDCRYIRNKVLDYDDKVGERALTGLALGLFLGPFGIPAAAAIDANQNKERELMNAEMNRRCVTDVANTPPQQSPNAADPAVANDRKAPATTASIPNQSH